MIKRLNNLKLKITSKLISVIKMEKDMHILCLVLDKILIQVFYLETS